jgi:hypothetical protein
MAEFDLRLYLFQKGEAIHDRHHHVADDQLNAVFL